jgi:hypothetical protein
MVAMSEPPRAGPEAAGLAAGGVALLHAAESNSVQAAAILRRCRATLDLTGQVLGHCVKVAVLLGF